MKKSLLKTKRSSHRNSKNKDLKKLVIWLIVICVLLFGMKSLVSGVSSMLTTPFFSLRHYIDTSSATIPVFLREREVLLDQIRLLEQEILAREGMNNTFGALVEENESLRDLLGASTTERIAAGVIARPPHTPYDALLIDRGAHAGVKENTPVYYGQGKVLGYVEKVYGNHSLVTLISSPNVETSVYVFGPDIFVTAYGEGGGVIRVSIPQGVNIGLGDLVVVPSIDGGILGDVERVESVSTEPEQHAYVTYEVPLQSIRLVSVGTNPLETVSFEEARTAVRNTENQFLRFEIPNTEVVILEESEDNEDEEVHE